jgi:hypothetical protein
MAVCPDFACMQDKIKSKPGDGKTMGEGTENPVSSSTDDSLSEELRLIKQTAQVCPTAL